VWHFRKKPQRLKPVPFPPVYGTTEEAAEKVVAVGRRADPSRLKPLGMIKIKAQWHG
jgi:hypothetical protein